MVKTKKTKKEKKKKEKEESPVAVEKAKKGGKKKKKKSSGETFFPSDISFLKKCNFFCFFFKERTSLLGNICKTFKISSNPDFILMTTVLQCTVENIENIKHTL